MSSLKLKLRSCTHNVNLQPKQNKCLQEWSSMTFQTLPPMHTTQLFSKLRTLHNKASKQEHLTFITWLRRMYELYIYITPDNYTLWVFQSHGYISKFSRGESIITEHHAWYTRSECGYNYSTLTIFQQCLINLYTVCGQRLGLSSL